MQKAPFTLSLILAGMIAASGAAADPYGAWRSVHSDDDSLSIADSFNRTSSRESNFTSSVQEDNDVISRISEDNDYTSKVREDNDYTSSVTEDNDYTSTVSEDNDVTKSWQQSTDVDFQIATPTLTSYKKQDQDAGHQADVGVLSGASGHTVGVEGGTNLVSAGNDETSYYGPALVNTNTNQLPQNNLFIQGSNGAPISQANTFAGRDMGPKGVFAPIGNTSAAVSGNVGSQAGASVEQGGDSSNSIADPMSVAIER